MRCGTLFKHVNSYMFVTSSLRFRTHMSKSMKSSAPRRKKKTTRWKNESSANFVFAHPRAAFDITFADRFAIGHLTQSPQIEGCEIMGLFLRYFPIRIRKRQFQNASQMYKINDAQIRLIQTTLIASFRPWDLIICRLNSPINRRYDQTCHA